MERNNLKLSIVIPCFNEEEGLYVSIRRLVEVLDSLSEESLISEESFLYLVDDGSSDATWAVIQAANKEFGAKVKGVKLTRNFGNQSAILAGIRESRKYDVGCIVTIDADLQQDETKIRDFLLKYKEGYDVVFGVRNDRKTDNFFKKNSSLMFYKFMKLMGVNLVPNHSEYRLMGKRALDVFSLYNERNIFIRGIFANIGLKSVEVPFDVKEREFGTTKFNFFSLMRLASWGVTSFSIKPLRIVFYTGLVLSFVGFIMGLICIWNFFMPEYYLFNNFRIRFFEVYEVFASGLQVLSIGVIGEYVGQILQEIKARPNYLVDEIVE